MSYSLVCALLAGLALAADEDAQVTKLKWGDPAPPLAIQEFVQGEPVEQFEPGKVYVVEFWATWCGPCLESIPHLSKLQAEHPDVVFLGISTDDERHMVPPFVKKMRGKMTYRVATEAPTEDDDEGAMSRDWLTAAGENGIPTAFIIDGESRIAWIGHPDELEEPLDEIVSGEWDIASAWSEREEELAQAKRAEEASAGLYIALARKDFTKALAIVERQIEVDPDSEDEQGTLKFWILKQLGDRNAAAEYGDHLLSATDEYDVERLTEIAGIVACPDEYAIGDYGGMDVDDGLSIDDMPDENEDADTDDDKGADEAETPAESESTETESEVATEDSSNEPVVNGSDSDESEPTASTDAVDDDTEGMEADTSADESTDDSAPDLAQIEDPLLRIALVAGHKAVIAAAELDMVDERAAAARVLAKAYALAGHPAQCRGILEAAVEALEESLGRRQSLIEQLKESIGESE